MIAPVLDSYALQSALARIREAGAGPVTNWFAPRERIDEWISRKSLTILEHERGLLILCRERGFCRVYHSAANLESLSAVLQSSSRQLSATGVLTTDLIGPPAEIAPVARIYNDCGFAIHNTLVRMIRTEVPDEAAQAGREVEFALPADVPAVAAFLNRLLDPYTDHVPDENEIGDAAARRHVILVRGGESLSGLILFDLTGLTSHLRYWYVDDTARNHGIGARLIRHFFRLSRGCKRLILWVVSDNADTIAKYRHYGFRPEAMVDRIMIRR